MESDGWAFHCRNCQVIPEPLITLSIDYLQMYANSQLVFQRLLFSRMHVAKQRHFQHMSIDCNVNQVSSVSRRMQDDVEVYQCFVSYDYTTARSNRKGIVISNQIGQQHPRGPSEVRCGYLFCSEVARTSRLMTIFYCSLFLRATSIRVKMENGKIWYNFI